MPPQSPLMNPQSASPMARNQQQQPVLQKPIIKKPETGPRPPNPEEIKVRLKNRRKRAQHLWAGQFVFDAHAKFELKELGLMIFVYNFQKAENFNGKYRNKK